MLCMKSCAQEYWRQKAMKSAETHDRWGEGQELIMCLMCRTSSSSHAASCSYVKHRPLTPADFQMHSNHFTGSSAASTPLARTSCVQQRTGASTWRFTCRRR